MTTSSHNWKLATRSLTRQRRATILNIIGLAFGFAFVIMISVFVFREFSYDTFHKDVDHIYKPSFGIIEASDNFDMASHNSLEEIELFRDNIPGLEAISFLNYSMWDWDNGAWVEYKGNKYNLEHVAFTDKYLPNVFSFKSYLGDLAKSLDNPNSLVLSKPMADKIFGSENPIGKTVYLNNKAITVDVVLEPIPSNSSIQITGLLNYKSAKYFFGMDIADYSCTPFIKTKMGIDEKSVSDAFSSLLLSELSKEEKEKLQPKFSTNLTPLRKLYFQEAEPYDPIKHGSKKLAIILMIIGITILFLAIINYNNIFLATSLKWNKDFGIQKIMGAENRSDKKQLFIKGFIISIISFSLSLIIIRLTLPWFNKLVNYPLFSSDFFNFPSLMIVISLLSITILISGLAPGLLFSKRSVVELIRGNIGKGSGKANLLQTMVTSQLLISITLISVSLVIIKQIQFGLHKDIGIKVNNVVTLPVQKLGVQRNEFERIISENTQTISKCVSSSYLNNFNIWGSELKQPDMEIKDIQFTNNRVGPGFCNTLDIKLVEGRGFDENNPLDHEAYIINEAMVKEYDIKNPLQSSINNKPIIGVVKDFNFNSLHHQIESMVLWNTPENAGLLSVYFMANTRDDLKQYMDFLQTEWKTLAPDQPFEYEFLNDRLKNMYEDDIKLAKSVVIFSLLAVFIACLGIFGLLSYIMETRIKEIGIRKVNGANIFEILNLINLDLVKWVTIATIISSPIAWIIMKQWLSNFAYQTNIGGWVFIISGCFTLILTLLTVSWQSWQAARKNPVEALRYE